MADMPITRVVLYKHGVGYFEREGPVEGDESVVLTFKQGEVSDVLKSLIVLDLDGGHVSSVSYDSTKPLEELLAEVALSIPEKNGLTALLPQLKGARVRMTQTAAESVEGMILGLDTIRKQIPGGSIDEPILSLLGDDGRIRTFELNDLAGIQLLDESVRRDLDYYLKTELSAKRKDARSFAVFARGEGTRRLRVAYNVAAPVWKATYRLILGEEGQPPMIQGWAVVDNTQDEDWENVQLSLVAGLPVSFVHDLYTPRYIRRPVVEVKETTGVLPPEVEVGMSAGVLEEHLLSYEEPAPASLAMAAPARAGGYGMRMAKRLAEDAISTTPAQVRERKLGDLFEYEIEHPVTIRRNQAALVPIVLREFKGRPVLLYNKRNRAENPMRCVEFENSTGLTLEGGPVTVLEGGSYVGEAMLETVKPDELRLVPFAVELSVRVLDNVLSRDEPVSRVVISRGVLKAQHGQVTTTTYHFDNKGDSPAVLYLDHPRESGEWTLLEPASPHEVTESSWRFRFEIAAKAFTTFQVRVQRLISQRFGLADSSDAQFHAWIEQRFLDDAAAGVLREVQGLRQALAEAEAHVRRLESERAAIHAEQERIRGNLTALGDRSSEKELRERFVRTLGTQEDRLEAIEKERATHERDGQGLRQRIAELLDRLSYAADLQGAGPGPPAGRRGGKGPEGAR
ncbi:MAG: hypothetical protein U0790_16630 [Isosphaeraceae bacterium]